MNVPAATRVELCALTVLSGFLYVRHRQREKERMRFLDEAGEGTGFDTSPVTPRLRELRQDYLTGLPHKPGNRGFRKLLLCASRRALGRFPYFRDRRSNCPMAGLKEEQL